ncbi:MAG: hypothetical protein CM15mP79_0060 [Methanobacteriota archaeon]|nr:MAG: hypothetical protein CM15mP79_0060 [Euryarchaeota archaeon]
MRMHHSPCKLPPERRASKEEAPSPFRPRCQQPPTLSHAPARPLVRGPLNGSNPRGRNRAYLRVRAVTVIGMPRRIPVVEGGVEQANFPVFWARDADVVQTGTEARGSRSNPLSAVAKTTPLPLSPISTTACGPDRRMQQASTPVVPCFREEHGFIRARQASAVWGDEKSWRRSASSAGSARPRRSTHVDQPERPHPPEGEAQRSAERLDPHEDRDVRSASVEKLETLGRLHVPVVPNHGLRPDDNRSNIHPSAESSVHVALVQHPPRFRATPVRARLLVRPSAKSRSEEQHEHQGGAHAFYGHGPYQPPADLRRRV